MFYYEKADRTHNCNFELHQGRGFDWLNSFKPNSCFRSHDRSKAGLFSCLVLSIVGSGCCIALWTPCWGRCSWLLCFSSDCSRFLFVSFVSNILWAVPCKNMTRDYAGREGPEQPAHPRSLLSTFTVHYQNYWILLNVWMESKDQIILCSCAEWPKSAHFMHVRRHSFAWRGPYYTVSLSQNLLYHLAIS